MKKLATLVVLALMTLLFVPGCSLGVKKYDKLVDLDEECEEKWSNIDTNLQRRKDMLPNLVAVVKGIAKHEEKVFTEVARARSGVGTCDAKCAADPAQLKKFQEQQAAVKSAMLNLVKLQETYPELRSSQNFTKLQDQIEGTENRILRARQEYNKAVKGYNRELRRVSGEMLKVVIGSDTFQKRPYYEADADAGTAPKLEL